MQPVLDANVDRMFTIAVTLGITFGFVSIRTAVASALGFGSRINRTLQQGFHRLGLNARSNARGRISGNNGGYGLWNWRDLHEESSCGKSTPIIIQKTNELLHIRYEEIFNHLVVNYKLDTCNLTDSLGEFVLSVTINESHEALI